MLQALDMSRPRLPRSAIALALLVVVAAVLLAPASARGDGDPASDVLTSQVVFIPADAGTSLAEQRALTGIVDEARSRGVAIRVAIISSPSDLGSVSALWHRPQPYAEFLGQELSLMFSGRLLVVMPNGLGLYHHGAATAQELDTLGHTPPGAGGRALTAAAIAAVRRLAAAAGHPLPGARAAASPAVAPVRAGSGELPWVVLGIGAALVALAWGLSLRAVPPRRRVRGGGVSA